MLSSNHYSNIRIAFITAILSAVFFVSLFIFLGFNLRQYLYDDSKEIAKEISRRAAAEAEQYFQEALMVTRSMAQRVVMIRGFKGSREQVREILQHELEKNPHFLATWTLWEPNAFDGKDNFFAGKSQHNHQGFLGITYYRYNNKVYTEIMTPSDFTGDYYIISKETKKDLIVEPYLWRYSGFDHLFFGTSLSVPLMDGENFLGVIGIDIDFKSLSSNLNKARPYQTGFLTLIASNGVIASHIDSTVIKRNFFKIIEKNDSLSYSPILNGNELTVETTSEFSSNKVFRFFYPIKVGDGKPWSIMVEIPINETTQRSEQIILVALIILMVGLGLILFLMFSIFERKKMLAALLESKELFQTLSQMSPVGIFRTRADGYTTYVNPKWSELSGLSFEEAQGDGWIKAVHPDDQELIKAGWNANNKNTFAEYRFIKPDGKTVWVLGNAFPEVKDGKLKGFIGTITNITEQKLTELALRESEVKYRTLMENVNEVIMMVDNDDRVLFVNQKFTETLGFSPDEIIGKIGYETLINPIHQELIISANKRRLEGSISQYEITFTSKDGKEIEFLVSGAPIMDSSGKTIGSIGAMMDITERNKTAKELENYKNHLEFMVKERTEELASVNEELQANNELLYNQREELEATLNKLMKAQKQLVRSEKMASLGVLAAGVAHEINNPLNFIQGGVIAIENYFKENLIERIDDVSSWFEIMKVGVKRAADIVTSLNHYSRKDESAANLCEIHTIIDNCLLMLQNQIKNRITIDKEYTTTPFNVLCNEGKMHQAILNILTNAVHSITENGSIYINTRLTEKKLCITISDSGSGISQANLSRITDPFFTTKDPGKGTGLGLSITQNIIEEHKGLLEFESEVGKGTKVFVYLPLK